MSNNLTLIHEIWKILKPSIEIGDINEASEDLVNYLIDEGFEADEIRQTFRSEREVKKQLEYYVTTNEEYEVDEEDLEDLGFGLHHDEDGYD